MITTLKLEDMSDRELLFTVEDLSQNNASGYGPTVGYANSHEIAQHLGLTHERKAQCVGARLSYMARAMDLVERKRYKGLTWYRVTALGRALMNGRLTEAQAKSLDKLNEGDMVMVTRYVSNRARSARRQTNKMLQREWRYGIARRN